jgi:alpha-beta hydrolase superfamily lysophospholipase
MKRSASMDNLAFATAVAVASRTLIFRARLLGKVKKRLPEDEVRLKISRPPIARGKQILDAVFVAPAGEPVRAAVLLCHGIGETVDHWFGVQKLLASQGVASLVFDYAGFGRSTGGIRWKQCEQDAIDAFGALQVLVPDSPVSILGFSLGGGIAAAVLDRISAQKLILCSSFTSFQDAACSAGLPRRLSRLSPPIWNTAETLGRCSLPVLVLHCENDRLFPRQMASDLVSSCKACVALVIVPDHEHNDPVYRPQRRYWDHVVSILVPDHNTRH